MRTDYDLSVLMLNEKFEYANQLSWTNLRTEDGVGVHSGDITSAPDGASEFIDIDLGKVECKVCCQALRKRWEAAAIYVMDVSPTAGLQ
jgi:stress response protein SCP2